MHELKIYKWYWCNHTDEWWKIWRWTDLSFQNWYEKFDKVWPNLPKVSKIVTLMSSPWAKYILFELKKYRGNISHDTEEWYKLWGIWLVVSRLIWWIWRILTQTLGSLKNLHFNELFLIKVFKVSAKILQRSYLSRHWKVIQNSRRNWLVVWKMTKEIW